MNRKGLFLCFILLQVVGIQAIAQKVKYKDLYVLLAARRFDEAEPFLKKYLKENNDNPNAFLYMGMIYHDKSGKIDMLRKTEELLGQIDSAVMYYEMAGRTITEKEISKNEEYYELYNRRDVRTGKFGVKLSDIKLDIDARLKLRDRAKLIKSYKAQFVALQSTYQKTKQFYTQISQSFPGQKEFYLRADDKLLHQLRQLSGSYDSCLIGFNDLKQIEKEIGKTGYNHEIQPREISDFKRDGLAEADFYKDELQWWDYKRWSGQVMDQVEKEIIPMQDQLVLLDVDLNKLQQQVKKDSVSVRGSFPAIRARMSFTALKRIDEDPMPLRLFEMKLAELDYGSQLSLDRSLRDSANVARQAQALQKQVLLARKLDSMTLVAAGSTFENDLANYHQFVTKGFGSEQVLKDLINSTRAFAKSEVEKRGRELKVKMDMVRWMIHGQDSIPLTSDTKPGYRFRSLLLQNEVLTAGVKVQDSTLTGYYSEITPNRKPGAFAQFELDSGLNKVRQLPLVKTIALQDKASKAGFVFFYSEVKVKDKLHGTLVRVLPGAGQQWKVAVTLSHPPEELIFSADTGELTIKTRSGSGDLVPIIIDKTGKQVH